MAARRAATAGRRRSTGGGGARGGGRRKGSIAAAAGALVLLLAGGAAGAWIYFTSPEKPALEDALREGREVVEETAERLPELVLPDAPEGELIVAEVRRVVDGDTLVVRYGGKEERVRLLNIDTPESVHTDAKRNMEVGTKAADFTRRRLEGAQVRLELPASGETIDTFGRRLAYLLTEGKVFNVELVREGFSPYYTKFGKSDRYDGEFRRAEREAKSNNRGIWADREWLARQEQLADKAE